MDGYIRVSRRLGREGPGDISPDVQREAIKRWAAYKDVEVDEWHVDEDWSGGTHERPGLERAIERATAGETGGIVLWKIDRFSRCSGRDTWCSSQARAGPARGARATVGIAHTKRAFGVLGSASHSGTSFIAGRISGLALARARSTGAGFVQPLLVSWTTSRIADRERFSHLVHWGPRPTVPADKAPLQA